MTNEEKFVNELIGYIFAYPDDDYMAMECLCRKLHKHGLIDKKGGEWTIDFIDRKTESDSEIPNNSKVSEKPTDSTRSRDERIIEMALNDCKERHNGCANCQTDCSWK